LYIFIININDLFKIIIILYIKLSLKIEINGDWGLGIGDWGLGIGDWAQSPIPNPQSPIPNPQSQKKTLEYLKQKINTNYIYFYNFFKKWKKNVVIVVEQNI